MLAQLPRHSYVFPKQASALDEPNGLLAFGGDLAPQRLLKAYQQGIFPWYTEGDPILWWSPNPRAVLYPQQLHMSRSLRKFLKRSAYQCTFNYAFAQVIDACAEQRANTEGTWITPAMQRAYAALHRQGHAHSVEVWQHNQLVGGLYGLLIGNIFCGESMFHRADNASKVALVALQRHLMPAGLRLIDCQMPSAHLTSLGAVTIPREQFIQQLESGIQCPLAPELIQPQVLPLL